MASAIYDRESFSQAQQSAVWSKAIYIWLKMWLSFCKNWTKNSSCRESLLLFMNITVSIPRIKVSMTVHNLLLTHRPCFNKMARAEFAPSNQHSFEQDRKLPEACFCYAAEMNENLNTIEKNLSWLMCYEFTYQKIKIHSSWKKHSHPDGRDENASSQIMSLAFLINTCTVLKNNILKDPCRQSF